MTSANCGSGCEARLEGAALRSASPLNFVLAREHRAFHAAAVTHMGKEITELRRASPTETIFSALDRADRGQAEQPRPDAACRPSAVAIAIRMPAYEPGPRPTTISSGVRNSRREIRQVFVKKAGILAIGRKVPQVPLPLLVAKRHAARRGEESSRASTFIGFLADRALATALGASIRSSGSVRGRPAGSDRPIPRPRRRLPPDNRQNRSRSISARSFQPVKIEMEDRQSPAAIFVQRVKVGLVASIGAARNRREAFDEMRLARAEIADASATTSLGRSASAHRAQKRSFRPRYWK